MRKEPRGVEKGKNVSTMPSLDALWGEHKRRFAEPRGECLRCSE